MLRSLDQLPIGTVVYTPDRGVIAVTPSFGEIVGRSVSDLLGKTMKDLTHPDDVAMNEWLLDNAIRNYQPFTLVKRYLRPDGSAVWVENRYEVFSADGLNTNEPVVCLLSRRMDDLPPVPDLPHAESEIDYGDYLREMTLQLAAIAKATGHQMCADLLRLAAKVSDED